MTDSVTIPFGYDGEPLGHTSKCYRRRRRRLSYRIPPIRPRTASK
jgi:hypothetical protein